MFALAPAVRANDPAEMLRDEIALAEKRIAIKRAHLKVAHAQIEFAIAKADGAKLAHSSAVKVGAEAERRLKVDERLLEAKIIGETDIADSKLAVVKLKAAASDAEAKVRLAEAEVTLERARSEVAQAEVEEAEWRLRKLRDRLAANKK